MDWPGGSWQATVGIAGGVVGVYLAILWASLLVWTYLDIRSRTSLIVGQFAAVAGVLLFNLAGLLVYLMLRPKETLAEAYERTLEEEALLAELGQRHSCPDCSRPVNDDFVVCPHCAARLRDPCPACSRPLSHTWVACPYCGAGRRSAAARRALVREEVARGAGAFSAILGETESDLPVTPGEPPFSRRQAGAP